MIAMGTCAAGCGHGIHVTTVICQSTERARKNIEKKRYTTMSVRGKNRVLLNRCSGLFGENNFKKLSRKKTRKKI